jgi:hypothetical protein
VINSSIRFCCFKTLKVGGSRLEYKDRVNMVALWTKTHLFNDLSSVTYMACGPDGSLVATAYQFKLTLKGEAIFVSSVNMYVCLSILFVRTSLRPLMMYSCLYFSCCSISVYLFDLRSFLCLVCDCWVWLRLLTCLFESCVSHRTILRCSTYYISL